MEMTPDINIDGHNDNSNGNHKFDIAWELLCILILYV